ncbi:uncharacterized protein LODBEIA_P20380 [Lodderomyces beijingensis]|uniref:CID domain-containing protein n=1 Tax=Lodderomyces beijingensis TaxID=1775926 RepID=A0ABP0ZI27_9ASCO
MSFQSKFASRLDDINETQESITSLSKYMLANSSRAAELVDVWKSQLARTSSNATRLLLIYLCNDVVQQAKRQNKLQFIDSFSRILPNVIGPAYAAADSTIRAKVDRVVSVWEQRSIFNEDFIGKFKEALKSATSAPPTPSHVLSAPQAPQAPPRPASPSIIPELRHINDLFQHIATLTDISQGNLTQLGIQSKTYLNLNADNLPKTSIHLNKLNVLEKLSKVSIKNIEDIKSTREKIRDSLETLAKLTADAIATDESKISVVNDKMKKIREVRSQLQGEVLGSASASVSRTRPHGGNNGNGDDDDNNKNNDNDDDDDDLPKYEEDSENSEEEKDDEKVEFKKRKISPSPGDVTPSRKVAFAEDIVVNEFEESSSSPSSKQQAQK